MDKKTIVFFCMDALGHIHPILSVAKELTCRGHKVIILTTRPLSMEAQYRERGYDFQSCTTNKQGAKVKDTNEALRVIMQPLMELFRAGLPESYKATYELSGAVGKNLQDMIDNHDIIETKLKSLKPDLIVFDHIIGVPCVTKVAPKWIRVYSGLPAAIYSATDYNCVAGLGLKIHEMTKEWKKFELDCKGPVREKLRRFFSEHNCTDWQYELDLVPHSPYLNIIFGIDETRYDQFFKPLPNNWIRFEHTIADEFEGKKEFTLPKELENKSGKLIYFSMGTLVTNDYETINRLLEIMSKSPNKFIVSKGQMHKHIKLYPNMWGEEFLDQRAILPKVDLFITHGGHNSIIESFYFGVPGVIVLPVFADQFDMAQRIADSKLGIRLNPYKCTEDELLEAIDSLLANEELAKRIKSISHRMQKNKYYKLMADELEKLVK